MEQNKIPSTDPSVWSNVYKGGDQVKIRKDYAFSDTNSVFKVVSILTTSTSPYKKDRDGNNKGGLIRPENPSGLLYELSNGQVWEGKDLELVLSMVFDEPLSRKKDLSSSFSEYDIDVDNIIILRVPSEQKGNINSPEQSSDSNEEKEVPKNIEDPFEDSKPQEKDSEGNDSEGKDSEGKDSEGKDSEGKDSEGKDSEGKDSEGKDSEGKDSEGKGNNGKQLGAADEDKDDEGKDAFGGLADDEIDFEQMMKNVNENFKLGNSAESIQAEFDSQTLSNALSTPLDKIKNIFKTKQVAKSAIGKQELFSTDNESRINNVLNEIFK